ncbi:MAG TPA: SpoIIE family protein phosphatase, partial [Puia sp.]|nr:SpoIIE family protein phosphatase [Puia sp.]
MKKRNSGILVFILLIVSTFCGQNKKMDSLNLALRNAGNDTTRLQVYLELCEECNMKDNLKYALPAIKLTEELLSGHPDSEVRRELLRQKGSFISFIYAYYLNKKNYSKAMEINQGLYPVYRELEDTMKMERIFANTANCIFWGGNTARAFDSLMSRLKYYEVRGLKKYIGFYQGQIASCYSSVNDSKKALEYYSRSLKLNEEMGDERKISDILRHMADEYSQLHEPEKALDCIFKSLKLIEKEHDLVKNFWIYFRIKACYEDLKDFEHALEYNAKCLALANQLQIPGLIANAYSFYAGTFKKMENFSKAEHYEYKSYEILKKLDDKRGIMFSLDRLAQLNYTIKKYELALKYADACEKIAREENDRLALRKMYELKFRIYQAKSDTKNALKYHLEYITVKDSMQKLESHSALEQKEIKYEFEKNEEKRALEQEKKDAVAKEERQQQIILRNSFIGGFLLLLVVAGLIFRSYRQKQKANLELGLMNETIARQKHLVEEKQKEIIESITYAKRLQEAILPPQEFVNAHAPDNFILYRPKDLVAGDFYWAEKIGSCFYIAAADSTGHGVPGAMVSVVCSNALNRTVKEFKETETGRILDKTRELVLETFEKSTSEVKDGMDISLLCIDSKNRNISWSGANNPLWYIEDSVLKEIKADKQPVGQTDYAKPFTTHQIEFKSGTTFYLFTDGFADQFGGPNGKKFKYKQFSDLLLG